MTANQITKKLTAAGIVASDKVVLDIDRDEVEVSVIGKDGTVSMDATARARGQIRKALGWAEWNGFRTGYGAWVVRPGSAMKDYEGVAARMHY